MRWAFVWRWQLFFRAHGLGPPQWMCAGKSFFPDGTPKRSSGFTHQRRPAASTKYVIRTPRAFHPERLRNRVSYTIAGQRRLSYGHTRYPYARTSRWSSDAQPLPAKGGLRQAPPFRASGYSRPKALLSMTRMKEIEKNTMIGRGLLRPGHRSGSKY